MRIEYVSSDTNFIKNGYAQRHPFDKALTSLRRSLRRRFPKATIELIPGSRTFRVTLRENSALVSML